MNGHSIRRAVAVLAAAALTATLASNALAAEVDPSAKRKPVVKCAGKVATKVGTPGRDVIRGTRKRDIIAGLGGNDKIDGRGGNDLICAGPGNDLVIGGTGIDRIYGQAGRDRLYGGPGPDWLAGQIGNDRLNGGIGVDTCHQGPGAGLKVSCERPLPPVVAPAPPPPAPQPKVLAIAYTDHDLNRTYDTYDVLISKLVDTNLDGVPSTGDTILMGRYPTDLGATAFLHWDVDRHTVATIDKEEATKLYLSTTIGGVHQWVDEPAVHWYSEYMPGDSGASYFFDYLSGADLDELNTWPTSPSQPADHGDGASDTTDNRFIDVDLLY